MPALIRVRTAALTAPVQVPNERLQAFRPRFTSSQGGTEGIDEALDGQVPGSRSFTHEPRVGG